jgi:V-type H+-transporting ATPase subunit D
MLGITGGGQTLQIARKQFFDLMKKIVEIAELQTAYLAVEECLKITNRRVNALEFIVVPKIEYVVKYIFTELEERSKEDKFKIKKILQVKRDALERAELELAMLQNNVTEKDFVGAFDENDDEDIREDERLFA